MSFGPGTGGLFTFFLKRSQSSDDSVSVSWKRQWWLGNRDDAPPSDRNADEELEVKEEVAGGSGPGLTMQVGKLPQDFGSTNLATVLWWTCQMKMINEET